MAKIYSAPKEIKRKKFNWDTCTEDDKEFGKQLADWCKANSSCPEAGKTIEFPVGDGAAVYMIFSLKPLHLIHVEVGDKWQYPYAKRLTSKDVKNELKSADTFGRSFECQS